MNDIVSDFKKDFYSIIHDVETKDVFNFEVTTTDKCNMGCSYCFEHEKCNTDMPLSIQNDTIRAIERILHSEIFMKKYKHMNITLWGGEPTINTSFINDLITYFRDEPRVTYYIYTNGILYDNLKRIIKNLNKYDSLSRATFQVSWDGNPVHDMHRLTIKKQPTSHIVMDTIKKLYKNGANISLKATIVPEDFKYFHEIWISYRDFLNSLLSPSYKNSVITYAPTIDQTYNNDDGFSEDLKKSLAKIVVEEYNHIREHNAPLLMWFDSSMKLCRYRSGMCCVTTNGTIYPCHGVSYDSKVSQYEHIGNISDDDISWFEKLTYPKDFSIPIECALCPATYCAVCSVQSSSLSKKNSLFEKWYDRASQYGLCRYYQIIGSYSKALHKLVTTDSI